MANLCRSLQERVRQRLAHADVTMLSILTLTTLFPNPVQPTHGCFVATRLENLVASGEVVATVIAPLPWLPSWVRYSPAGRIDLVPRTRLHGTVTVHHPRYLVVPKIGM